MVTLQPESEVINLDLGKPGLAPRKLEGEVEKHVESDRYPAETTVSEQPSVEQASTTAGVSDNTEANQGQEQVNEAQEQPLSNRANERIQSVIAERDAEKAARQRAEEMLSRLVNVPQAQPTQSESELLAKQYKTFDPIQGYPTDPKEYAGFVENRARLAAQQEAQQQQARFRESQETADLLRAYPNIQSDPILIGAMTAQKAAAQARGVHLSYKDAADMASKDLEARSSKRLAQQVAQSEAEKNEAYVESSRASSSTRSGGQKPDLDNMSLAEMEAWMKKDGSW